MPNRTLIVRKPSHQIVCSRASKGRHIDAKLTQGRIAIGAIQASLDALETLIGRHGFAVDEVKELIVRLPARSATTVDNRDLPDICVQHMLAIMLMDKTASFRAAHDEPRMHDPAVLRQRAKVKLIADEELDRRRPNREAIVEVTLTDGRAWREHVAAVRGTAANPMTRAEVVGKCRDLMAPVLGICGRSCNGQRSPA